MKEKDMNLLLAISMGYGRKYGGHHVYSQIPSLVNRIYDEGDGELPKCLDILGDPQKIKSINDDLYGRLSK